MLLLPPSLSDSNILLRISLRDVPIESATLKQVKFYKNSGKTIPLQN